jgi:predicted glycoside hydrolase/deacetylase ChbG (UPF0249 family)
MRYLIINTDDFGVCAETNKAIEHIFNEGIVSSATIMTPCPAAEDAVARAKANERINVGLHITTNAEWVREWGQWKPIAPPEQVSSLIDNNGYFFSSVADFTANAKANEVITEMEAQYNFMTSRGVLPAHADSHMGSVYGLGGISFMKEVLEFCAKYKLPFRFPKNVDIIKGFLRTDSIPAPLAQMHPQVVGYASALGVKLIDNLFSSLVDFSELTGYEKLKEIYFAIISDLPEGVSEIYLHPSTDDSPIGANNPKWFARVWEYKLLLDDELKLHLEKENIKLITYSEIP